MASGFYTPEFVIDNLPVLDIVSDIYLLVTVWPWTVTSAPSSLQECSSVRSLWYVALAFILVGTLVDLFPELMLLTEVILHPTVLCDGSGAWKVVKLLCSDGKPIIRYAASEDDVGEALVAIRDSLRKRLHFFGRDCWEFGLWRRGEGGDDGRHIFMYSGLLGCLAAGELLTAVGGVMFLVIDFGWPALVSVLASMFSFLATTKHNMTKIANLANQTRVAPVDFDTDGQCFPSIVLAIPGPVAFLKVLLGVPVWPLSLVAWGSALLGVPVWPFTLVAWDEFRDTPASEPVWVWPPHWFGASSSDPGRGVVRVLDWLLFPQYGLAWVSAAVLLLIAVCCVVWLCIPLAVGLLFLVVAFVETVVAAPYGIYALLRCYFNRDVHRPDCLWCASQALLDGGESFFLSWGSVVKQVQFSKVIQVLELAFGSGMDHLYNIGCGFLRELPLFEVSFFTQAVVLGLALSGDECAELEWAFASAHAAWFMVICFNRGCVRCNPFNARTVEVTSPQRSARFGPAYTV